jgi:hypothetical protein
MPTSGLFCILVSDTSVTAFGPLDDAVTSGLPAQNDSAWGVGVPSVLVAEPDPAWTATINGASWISTAAYREDPNAKTYRKFELEFTLPASDTGYTGRLHVAGDNAVNSILNNNYVGYWGSFSSVGLFDISSYLVSGLNKFQFRLTNTWSEGTNYPVDNLATNPTGLLFKAEISSNPVPEPTTMLLFGAGIAGIAAVGRRRRM